MSSRQLEILVKARDQASGVFREVGGSAEGLGRKLGGLNELAETGHGLHKMLRAGKNIAVAFEVIPVAFDAAGAAFATLTGSAAEAAEGQRKLYEAIKEVPLVGKFLGPFAEKSGAAIAHAFGKQSTAEIEAETEKKKKALEGFAEATKKIGEVSGKTHNEAALAGLAPSDAAIERAKQKYRQTLDELKPLKQALLAGAGAADSVDKLAEVRAQAQRIATIQKDAARALQAELAQIQRESYARQLAEDREFTSRLADEERQRQATIADLRAGIQAAGLEALDRGYEASVATRQAALDKQLEQLNDDAERRKEEIGKQIIEQAERAGKGDTHAADRITQLQAERVEIGKHLEIARGLAEASALTTANRERDLEIRKEQERSLGLEASAGNIIAKEALDRLSFTREQAAAENALRAIIADQNATYRQQAEAQRELDRLGQARKQHEEFLQQQSANTTRDAGIFLLQQEASLGDKIAEQELRKAEIQKSYNEEKKKLIDLLRSEHATAAQKKQAQRLLSNFDKVESEQLKRAGAKEGQGQLATLSDQFYTTGVAAAVAQERSPYLYLKDAQDKTTTVVDSIRQLLEQFFQAQQNKQYQVVR